MEKHSIFLKHPELRDFLYLLRHEIQHAQRPAHEIILDDEDVMRHLKISKRKLQYIKAAKGIPVHFFEPGSPRTYYLLSDILDILKKNRVESITENIRIK